MRTNRHCDVDSAPGRRGAFTLVEIMIVVGIIAVVTAMAMPGFVQMLRKEPMRKAVSDIVDACTAARAQAILQGVPAEVTIRADGSISVSQVGTNATDRARMNTHSEPNRVGETGASLFSARLHDDIVVTLLYVNLKNRMDADQTKVHFYPNGTSDDFTIVLESKSGIRKVSLECVTGLPTVEAIR